MQSLLHAAFDLWRCDGFWGSGCGGTKRKWQQLIIMIWFQKVLLGFETIAVKMNPLYVVEFFILMQYNLL